MRTFTTIWAGQVVSTIGSYMTSFAIKIWAWELTGQATTLALVGFFSLLPSIIITLFAGMIVDRCNRKYLLMAGDSVAALSTLALLLLYLTGHLEVWHLYITGALNGAFGELQELAYSASITLMVPKEQYARASSMVATIHYGSIILAPALAGVLYAVIGFAGIAAIDLTTFTIAISTVWISTIPQPSPGELESDDQTNIWQQLGFGFRYIYNRPGLWAIALLNTGFWFMHDLGGAIFAPMILARTGNNAKILGSISSAAGIGGVTGASLLSLWGGPKQRIHGLLLGMIGAGLSKSCLGVGRSPWVWLPAQFCSSLNFPLMSSSLNAIWMAKVEPAVQGRVFAARSFMLQVVSAIATLMAGPLADSVFEPAMASNRSFANLFGTFFGTGAGSGMAIFYVMTSLGLLSIGLGGYALKLVREVEQIVPDYDQKPEFQSGV